MALTEDEIVAGLEKDLTDIDPTADVKKGPLKRLFVNPHAKPLVRALTKLDRFTALFTLQRVENMTADELEAQIRPFSGMYRFQGEPVTGYVTFYMQTNPNQDVLISTGDQVADETSSLIFVVMQDVLVPAASIPRLYNPVTRRYEIIAPVQAIEAGAKYAVATMRIRQMLTKIPYVTGVVNNYAFDASGADRETNAELNNRFLAKIGSGSELGTQGGMESEIRNIPGVKDVATVTSADSTIFSRRTEKPALDVYVIGNRTLTDVYVVPANQIDGKTAIFSLPKHRITRIQNITITAPGGAETTAQYSFIADQTIFARSTLEQNRVELTTMPVVGSVVKVTYDYNALLEQVQTKVNNIGAVAMFNTDTLVFEAKPVDMVLSVEVTTLSSFTTAQIRSIIQEHTLKQYNTRTFISQTMPEDYRSFLKDRIPSLTGVFIQKFSRLDKAGLDIQTVSLERNEYLTLKASNFVVSVR